MIGIYSLPNYLKTCLQPYIARSACSDTLEVDELIDIMATGRTPFGSFYLSASGRFEQKNQAFTPGEGTLDHALTLHFRTNKTIEAKIIARSRWERIENFDTSAASIEQITVVGRAAGENARAGDTVKLAGRRMKFDAADVSCGIFLESGTESFRASVYADISPSKVIAIIPETVPAGSYDLIVVTMPNGKDLKNGYAEKPFVIA